jgi:hypothetical protein
MSFNLNGKRREKRLPIRFPASICWLDDSGQEITAETFTINVSDSGLGLMTKQSPSVGSRVKVTLDVEGLLGTSIAEVKWTKSTAGGFRVGVSFKLVKA